MSDSSIKDLINSIPKGTKNKSGNNDFINDENYIDASEEIIKDALKNGFDVIHMENGDIITTGTKVIITQYHWDSEKKKMVKVMSKAKE
ncbi:MAG TPA: hypothetical protein DIV86_07585 [Alphaproteobacteria bacterium]|nr:hypothetical protein [Alphaproteobacteria bacterium]